MGSRALVAEKLIADLSDGRREVFEGRWVIMGRGDQLFRGRKKVKQWRIWMDGWMAGW